MNVKAALLNMHRRGFCVKRVQEKRKGEFVDLKPVNLLQHAINDQEHIKRNTILQIVIVTIAFVLLCRIWPFGLIERHTESKQQAYSSVSQMQGETFSQSDKKLQTVHFTREHIGQIMLYLTCSEEYDADSDFVIFRLYNDSFSCIYEETQGFGLLEKRGGFLATPDLDVVPGKDYYYEVIVPEEVVGCLYLPVTDRNSLEQEENTVLYIDGIYHEELSLVADFDYTKELSVIHIIAYDFLILAVAALCYLGILWLLYTFENYLETVLFYGKRILSVLAITAALGFMIFATIMNGFGGEIADRIVYAISSAVALGWFWCALWTGKREKKVSKLTADRQISLIWRNYIQTWSFALLFYALCQYVNADREYYHQTNTRWMLIFLGISLFMVYSEKKISKYLSGIWMVLSIAGSFIYCFGIQEEKELYVAKLSAAVVVVWGLVILNTFAQIKKDFWKTIHWPMFAVWLLFVVFMWLNRFDRVWVYLAVLPFLSLLFMNLNAAGKSRLLKNFTNGIILSFGLVMLFCFMHRPFHYWMRYRYNGIFHTVACTGMYLALVAGALIGKLYAKWTSGKGFLQTGKAELFLLSFTISNIFLSMSRTALLTVGVNIVFVAILAIVVCKKSWKRIFCEFCMLGVAFVLTFPLTYTTVRVIPAIYNEPVRYDLEPQERFFMIYEGDKIDSDKYMTIKRFFTVFFGRFQPEEARGITIEEETTLLANVREDFLPVIFTATEEGQESFEERDDISNGRFEIFLHYWNELNMMGHEGMEPEGYSHGHAHNSYLQVAFDFGIIAGILFLILCFMTLWHSIVLACRYGRKYTIYYVPCSLIVVFGFNSLTEWAFHPCIPVGFAFLFVQMLVMQELQCTH